MSHNKFSCHSRVFLTSFVVAQSVCEVWFFQLGHFTLGIPTFSPHCNPVFTVKEGPITQCTYTGRRWVRSRKKREMSINFQPLSYTAVYHIWAVCQDPPQSWDDDGWIQRVSCGRVLRKMWLPDALLFGKDILTRADRSNDAKYVPIGGVSYINCLN